MKNLILFSVLLFLVISCSKTKKTENHSNPVAEFLTNTNSLESSEIGGKTPIKTFESFANDNASKTIQLTKQNIKASLTKANDYKYCVILVANHTLVKITDLKKCIQSGSWGACMPFAEGYIKKGNLKFKKDYINNIIGRPDSQKRTMYLFN